MKSLWILVLSAFLAVAGTFANSSPAPGKSSHPRPRLTRLSPYLSYIEHIRTGRGLDDAPSNTFCAKTGDQLHLHLDGTTVVSSGALVDEGTRRIGRPLELVLHGSEEQNTATLSLGGAPKTPVTDLHAALEGLCLGASRRIWVVSSADRARAEQEEMLEAKEVEEAMRKAGEEAEHDETSSRSSSSSSGSGSDDGDSNSSNNNNNMDHDNKSSSGDEDTRGTMKQPHSKFVPVELQVDVTLVGLNEHQYHVPDHGGGGDDGRDAADTTRAACVACQYTVESFYTAFVQYISDHARQSQEGAITYNEELDTYVAKFCDENEAFTAPGLDPALQESCRRIMLLKKRDLVGLVLGKELTPATVAGMRATVCRDWFPQACPNDTGRDEERVKDVRKYGLGSWCTACRSVLRYVDYERVVQPLRWRQAPEPRRTLHAIEASCVNAPARVGTKLKQRALDALTDVCEVLVGEELATVAAAVTRPREGAAGGGIEDVCAEMEIMECDGGKGSRRSEI